MSIEKSRNNYDLLYKFSNQPYKPSASWTTSTTFVPDKILDKPSFEIDELFVPKQYEFILDTTFGADN